MKRWDIRIAAAAVVVAAFAIAGPPSWGQDATTSTTTTTSDSTATSTTTRRVRTTATPEMIEEAVQRSKARHERFLATGTPEQWGSEEPFTFSTAR